jgi:hypothetical protein
MKYLYNARTNVPCPFCKQDIVLSFRLLQNKTTCTCTQCNNVFYLQTIDGWVEIEYSTETKKENLIDKWNY